MERGNVIDLSVRLSELEGATLVLANKENAVTFSLLRQ
jgi:hypothetical protein